MSTKARLRYLAEWLLLTGAMFSATYLITGLTPF